MVSQRPQWIADRSVSAPGRQGAAGVGWPLFAAVATIGSVLFAVAPWPLEHKTHVALHGLCAQIPSHTFRFGDRALPFDARMTGIYGGFFVTAVVLAGRGRLRSFRMPPMRVAVTLGAFVLAMALDGGNSLLVDLRLPHLYPPDNRLRLATGLLTGVALATVLAFVFATTLWRQGRWDQAPIAGLRELAVAVLATVPFAALATSGFGPLYVPLTVLLMASAVAVVSVLMLIVVVLVKYGDRPFAGPGELPVPATVALLLGVAVMAAFAAGRLLIELVAGPSPLV